MADEPEDSSVVTGRLQRFLSAHGRLEATFQNDRDAGSKLGVFRATCAAFAVQGSSTFDPTQFATHDGVDVLRRLFDGAIGDQYRRVLGQPQLPVGVSPSPQGFDPTFDWEPLRPLATLGPISLFLDAASLFELGSVSVQLVLRQIHRAPGRRRRVVVDPYHHRLAWRIDFASVEEHDQRIAAFPVAADWLEEQGSAWADVLRNAPRRSSSYETLGYRMTVSNPCRWDGGVRIGSELVYGDRDAT